VGLGGGGRKLHRPEEIRDREHTEMRPSKMSLQKKGKGEKKERQWVDKLKPKKQGPDHKHWGNSERLFPVRAPQRAESKQGPLPFRCVS